MFLKITICLFLFFSQVTVSIAQYAFSLPENTGYKSGYSQVVKNQYVRIVSDQFKGLSHIEYYDLKTGKLSKQVTFSSLGFAASFYLEPNNTIWLFDESTGMLIKTVDAIQNKKIEVIGKLPVPSSGYFTYAGDMKWSPIYFYKNSFYLINGFDRTTEIQVKENLKNEFIQSVDISTEKVKSHVPIPGLFFDRDYGMMNKFSSLRKDNLLIIAPNFSNEIFIYNLENGNIVFPILDEKNDYYQVASPLLTRKNFDISKTTEQTWYNRTQKHYQTSNEYINILYDPYKKQYYRTLILKDPKLGKEIGLKIIVLNSRFNFVKVQELTLDYKPDGMFVTEKGLNILNYKKYKENNNQLNFETFKL